MPEPPADPLYRVGQAGACFAILCRGVRPTLSGLGNMLDTHRKMEPCQARGETAAEPHPMHSIYPSSLPHRGPIPAPGATEQSRMARALTEPRRTCFPGAEKREGNVSDVRGANATTAQACGRNIARASLNKGTPERLASPVRPEPNGMMAQVANTACSLWKGYWCTGPDDEA